MHSTLRSKMRSTLVAAACLTVFLLPATSAAAAPPAPAGFHVADTSFDSVSLAWSRVDGTEFYRVLVDGVWRSGVYDPATGVTVRQLRPGLTYTFEVQARTAAGDFGRSAILRASTLPDNEVPTPPGGLRETQDGNGRSTGLTWNGSTDNWAVVGYKIYADGQLVMPAGPPTEWFWLTDPYHGGLACGKTYTFTVRAVDKNNNLSPQSAPLTAATQSC